MADCTDSKEDTNAPRLPAVMELDGVDESSENSANDEVEEQSCEENSRPKILFSSKFHDNSNTGSALMYNSTFSPSKGFKSSFGDSILRPSQLGGFSFNSSTLASTSTSLNINNEKKNNHNNSNENNEDNNDADNDNKNKNNDTDNDNNINKETNKNLDDKKLSSGPKFLPLLSNIKDHDNNTNNSMTSHQTSVSGFVFGQNFNERATVAKNNDDNENKKNDKNDNENKKNNDDNNINKNNINNDEKVVNNDNNNKNDDDNNDENNGSRDDDDDDHDHDDHHHDNNDNNKDEDKNNENGGLFSTVATSCRTTSRPGITLSQAAQEIEEANRANKRKYNEVALKTGEEDEINVLQINNAKLFTFDKETSGWKERGRGPLRLNDRDEESRLIGRTSGTQRLMLNTKIWPGMTAELAGPKSLRLTAMDILDDKVSGDIRIFIIQAAPKEVDELHELLIQRITRAKERQPKKIATSV